MIRRCDTSSLNIQLLQLEQSQLSALRADSSNISYQHFLNLFYKQQKPTKFLLYSYVCARAKKSSPPPPTLEHGRLLLKLPAITVCKSLARGTSAHFADLLLLRNKRAGDHALNYVYWEGLEHCF